MLAAKGSWLSTAGAIFQVRACLLDYRAPQTWQLSGFIDPANAAIDMIRNNTEDKLTGRRHFRSICTNSLAAAAFFGGVSSDRGSFAR
jgi:hypothetical protein